MAETKQLFSSPRCQHIHFNGRPCKAPARRGRNFCVFHQAAHFDAAGCVLPIIEDMHSYQLAIIRILRALADDIIDPKKATALLYGLQLVGAKLDAFVAQRNDVENPFQSLRDALKKRHADERDLKYAFDSVPEKDLGRILADLAAEQSTSPNPNISEEATDESAHSASESRDLFPPRSPASSAVNDLPHTAGAA